VFAKGDAPVELLIRVPDTLDDDVSQISVQDFFHRSHLEDCRGGTHFGTGFEVAFQQINSNNDRRK
jgi:hypothetical protein